MKANELRIGNIIKLSESNEIFMAYEICSSGFRVRNKNEDTWIEEWQFEGIELTEERLVKFGFELDYKSDYSISYGHIKNCKFSYKFNITENKSWLEYHGGAIECKYAHQLQNIYFALTGEELAIA